MATATSRDAAPSVTAGAQAVAPTATASASPPLPSRCSRDAGAQEIRLDWEEADREAKAAGYKGSLSVPSAVCCPAIAPPASDPAPLAARPPLAGLIVDPDGFLRENIGVPEAVAQLGKPALCNHDEGSGYRNIYLATALPNVEDVYLETQDGDLIGVAVHFEKPVAVDMTALTKRYGEPKRYPGPDDSFEAGGSSYHAVTAGFDARLLFSHRDHRDPETAWQVHRIIFRRTPMIEVLPEGFHDEAEVARLVALALRPRAPEWVAFAGTIGICNPPVENHISCAPGLPVRNVATASMEKRTRGKRDFVRSMSVTFQKPIPATAASLAAAIGAALHVAAPTAVAAGGLVRLDLPGRGTLRVKIGKGALETIRIDRAPEP